MTELGRIFLPGETVDLCPPDSEKDFREWADLLNDSSVTRNLQVGSFPLVADTQRQYFREATESGRVVLLVKSRRSQELLGVCSLSGFEALRGFIMTSTVVPRKDPASPLAPLEALALITQHAFSRFPVQRVYGGHKETVSDGFIFRREILGFFAEGYFEKSTYVDGISRGSFVSAVTRTRYDKLVSLRGGSLWPGVERANRLIDALVSENAVPLHLELRGAVLGLQEDAMARICRAEECLPLH